MSDISGVQLNPVPNDVSVHQPVESESKTPITYSYPNIFAYFQHPTKGLMYVDTYAKAMEVYDITNYWIDLELANMIPNAPS